MSEFEHIPGLDDADELGVESIAHGPTLPAHFYFHVPFCRSKCSYCDFCSVADADPQEVFAVFAGLETEVRRWAVAGFPGVVETVYVGGGTPSLHPGPVASLLAHVRSDLPLRPGAEITVEANPDSLSASTLETLLEAGVTRVSVGVQAFDDAVLRLLGRAHDARQARHVLALLSQAGVDFSADLMCGVPGQTMASWRESVEQVLDAGATHASVYPLAVEDGTSLSAAVSSGLVPEPDPDLAADMMIAADERFADAGLKRYEVANFAVPGHESRHNTAYWTGHSYAGVGPAAHGMLDAQTARAIGLTLPDSLGGREVERVRYANVSDVKGWLFGAQLELELLAHDSVVREDVMLGLRLTRGVPAAQVEAAGLSATLEGLAADGLVTLQSGRWSTTRRGWLLGNEVFGRVWAGE